KAQEDAIHLEVPRDKQLQGAKLSSMTQSMAYRGIKEMHKPVSHLKTDENMKIVQEAVKNIFSFHPKSPAKWKSIPTKTLAVTSETSSGKACMVRTKWGSTGQISQSARTGQIVSIA
ncbi:hypothetical protein B0H13DRAFT_1633331, partial [Mycena leptocephala]